MGQQQGGQNWQGNQQQGGQNWQGNQQQGGQTWQGNPQQQGGQGNPQQGGQNWGGQQQGANPAGGNRRVISFKTTHRTYPANFPESQLCQSCWRKSKSYQLQDNAQDLPCELP